MSENRSAIQHVDNLSSLEAANIQFRMTVERKWTPLARVVLFLMYFCVAFFTFLGTMWGFPMLILTLGTLFYAWYYKGVTTITYDYQIDGHEFTIRRIWGLRGYTKNIEFARIDLSRVIVIGDQFTDVLEEAEALFEQAPKTRRVTYYTSAHNPNRPGILLYARGVGAEEGYIVKVYLQPSGELLHALKLLCPGKMYANGD